jgi:hypothetical protein
MAIVTAIVTLFLIAGLSMALVRITLTAREEVQDATRRAQADWLAEAGLNRAAARLQRQPAYTGETWDVARADLADVPGRVEIRIVPDPTAPLDSQRKQATVTADYPRELPRRHRVVRTTVLKLPTKAPAAKTEALKK